MRYLAVLLAFTSVACVGLDETDRALGSGGTAGGQSADGTGGFSTAVGGTTSGAGGRAPGDPAGMGGTETASGGTFAGVGGASGGVWGTGSATGGGGVTGAGGSGVGGGAGVSSGGAAGGPDPNFHIFLLIGQSNMEGVPPAAPEDKVESPRVKVLARSDCANLGRTYNQWYTATPPLHSCNLGVGPGDYFGKKVAEALPNATIGLVPSGIAGVDINFFRKGVVSSRRQEFQIPPDNHWSSAYDWVVSRARVAQESGVIRGILFHQGESDTGQQAWVAKVKDMVEDLRADLALGDVPFLAGELMHGGCCQAHNSIIAQLPSRISNAHVISASGLGKHDQYHFDLAGQRTLGERYATKFLEVWEP